MQSPVLNRYDFVFVLRDKRKPDKEMIVEGEWISETFFRLRGIRF